jgi:hypothetical protein
MISELQRDNTRAESRRNPEHKATEDPGGKTARHRLNVCQWAEATRMTQVRGADLLPGIPGECVPSVMDRWRVVRWNAG